MILPKSDIRQRSVPDFRETVIWRVLGTPSVLGIPSRDTQNMKALNTENLYSAQKPFYSYEATNKSFLNLDIKRNVAEKSTQF